MTSDLRQGILSAIYSTWLHNSLAIGLVLGIGLTAILLIFKPKRKYVFFLLGFILLLLQFEYQKHFGKALEDQTIIAVIGQGESPGARSLVRQVFSKAIPFLLWFFGWGLVFLGVVF